MHFLIGKAYFNKFLDGLAEANEAEPLSSRNSVPARLVSPSSTERFPTAAVIISL
jgi:hypothetical protein